MKKGAKQDWAERTAKRVLSNDELTLGFGSNSVEDIAALAKLLRRAGDRCTPRKARSTAMKKGAKQDWAERAVERAVFPHLDRNEAPFHKIVALVRRAERRGYERGLMWT